MTPFGTPTRLDKHESIMADQPCFVSGIYPGLYFDPQVNELSENQMALKILTDVYKRDFVNQGFWNNWNLTH